MAKNNDQSAPGATPSNTIEDPKKWTAGDDPTSETWEGIDELRQKTGRGRGRGR